MVAIYTFTTCHYHNLVVYRGYNMPDGSHYAARAR